MDVKAGTHIKEVTTVYQIDASKFTAKAHYNLADAYWALGEKTKAIASYATYVEQMKEKGKEKRIPQVVRDRVSSK